MPITTYIDPATLRHTQDPDICEALASLAQPPVVEERALRLWRPRAYRVLWFLTTTPLGEEYQVVNFYRDPPHPSSTTAVPKELVLAYLYGCAVQRKNT